MSDRNNILSELRLGKDWSVFHCVSSENIKISVCSFLVLFITTFFVSPVHAAAPAISIDNTSLSYSENDPATQVDSIAVLSDPDGDADWNGGTLVGQITANNEAADELSIADNIVGNIKTSGTTLLDDVTAIGTLSHAEGTVTNGTALTITFNASATNALVQQVLQSISYRNTSEAPGTLDRTVTLTATDGNLESANDARTITVGALNDAPTAIAVSTTSILQGSTGAGADIGNLSSTDIDSVAFTYSLVAEGTSDAGSCGVGNDIDNVSFQITSESLQTAGVLTVGNYKICIQTNDGAATFQQTFDVTVTANPADSDGSLTSAAGVSEPVALPWSVDTAGEAVDLFDFTLTDGGTFDSFAMTVSQIVINVTGTSTDTERNKITWRLNGSDVSNATGIYNAVNDTITFSGLNISIADGTSEAYTVNGFYNDNTGLTNGSTAILSVDGDTDLTVGASGTLMAATATVNNLTGTIISDNIMAAVSSVAVPANNTYGPGDNLNFTVNFNENITVSGTPRLTLTIGSTTRFANYVSGSGSSALLFRYSVQTGDLDLDGISLGSTIGLNSGTLQDSASNNTSTTLNGIASLIGVLVEAAAPVFQNSTPSVSATTISQTTLTVRLDEVGTVYYVLLPNGAAAPSVAQVKAGNNSSNTAAFKSGTINVASAGVDASVDIIGLTNNTPYDLYVVAEDQVGNLQTTVTKRDFTTNSFDNDGNLTSAAGVIEPVVLPWSVDTVGEAIDLFDFTLSDGGASDGLPMTASQIVIQAAGTSNDTERNKVNWRLNGSNVNNVSGVYDGANNTITFSGLNISIADGASEVYTVNGYFNNTVGVIHNRTITLRVDGDSDLTIGSSGTSMGVTSVVNNGAGTVLSDDVQPAVTSVTTPPDNTYTAGDNLNFTVNFDENITVSGAPRLTLTIGSATRFANYVSGSGSSALLFRYNIQAGEQDSNGISLGGSINLNSATLRDSANNNIVTTLNNPGNLSSVLVEAAAPVFQNGTPSVSATTLTQATLSVRLNETGTVYYVLLPNGSGQPSPAQVKAGNNSSNGSAFRSGNINVSSANTNFTSNITGLTAGTAYDLYAVAEDGLTNLQAASSKVDFSTNPQNSDGNLTSAATVIEPVALGWSVDTVGEAINLFDFTLRDGGTSDGLPMSVSQIIIRVFGSSTDAERAKVTWRLQGNDVNNAVGVYNAGSNTITFSGLNISIADGGSEIYTVNGYYNDNTGLTHSRTIILRVDGDTDLTVGTSGTLMGSTSIVMNGLGTQIRDDIQPTVSSVSVPANSTYAPGNNLDFDLNFNENVTVNTGGGVPRLTLTIGSATRFANYVSGSGTSLLSFRYTVQAGDQDSNGISIASNVALNGGTIRDSASNNANTGLNNVGSLVSVFVDAVASSLAEVTPVMTPTNDSTPNVTFSSAEAGTFTVGGVCGSADEGSVPAGNTTIALTQANNVTLFASGTYSGCSITLTDASNNVSSVTLSDFVIDLVTPSVVTNTAKSVGEGGIGNISTAELNSTDNVSAAANIIYTVISPPANGILVKNGSASSILAGGTFTQDEINNSLISYSNTNIGPTSDTFTFNISDQAGNVSSVSSFNFVIGNDLDGDGIADNTDTDDDGDGIPDDWEIANGLDPRDASDATGDLDGDGKDNLTEFTEGTNPNTDDNPPVISLEDITLDATGLFTSVNVIVEGNVSANDSLDGPVSVSSPDLTNSFMPGVTVITWSAVDAAGNEATKEQKININPIVNFSVDQVVAENSTGRFRVILNGEAVSYPVNVPYTIVGGTADSNDHNLPSNGTVIITSGNTEAEVMFNVSDAGGEVVENDENILLSLRALPANVVRGSKFNLDINITENNVAPMSMLSATQAAFITQLVTITDGNVVVSSSIVDPNTDTHTHDWSMTDNVLIDTDSDDTTFTFDPSGLASGAYTVRLSVSDGSATSESSLMLTVLDAAPVLTSADSDGDIIDDQTEGFGDLDVDGIPDYLDNFDAPNLLPSIASPDMAVTFPLETEPGLRLVLGSTAFQAGKGQAGVGMTDIAEAGLISDVADFNYPGGLFDFEIVELGVAGKSVKVVLPQQQAIPANAIYRKLVQGAWQEFVTDANNSFASTQGAPGVCPSPGSVLYQNGLFEGHHCVQLTIEDGGVNDSDGAANNRIVDPGGVTAALVEPPAPSPKSDNSNGIFGLGSLNLWWLSLFALFGLRGYCIRTK